MKKRDFSLDLIRCIAIFMIFTYHFFGANGMASTFLCRYKNGGWGSAGTAVFFILSGYCIQMHRYHFSDTASIFTFYKKRFFSIFPLMWITFLLGYTIHALLNHNFQYGGSIWKILFSFLGIDGYLIYFGVPNYYITGEWFTAMIILTYLLYPLLQKCMLRHRWVTTTILAALYFGYIVLGKGPVPADAAIFTATFLFWIGMFLYEYRETLFQVRHMIIPINIALILLITMVKLPYIGSSLPWKNLLSVNIFLLLYLSLTNIDLHNNIRKHFVFQSKVCYAIYLCHHVLIAWVPLLFNRLGYPFHSIKLQYVVTLLVTELVSIFLYTITQKILKRPI